MFWIGYFRLEALISILLHVLLLKHALDNGELRLPYVQEWP